MQPGILVWVDSGQREGVYELVDYRETPNRGPIIYRVIPISTFWPSLGIFKTPKTPKHKLKPLEVYRYQFKEITKDNFKPRVVALEEQLQTFRDIYAGL